MRPICTCTQFLTAHLCLWSPYSQFPAGGAYHHRDSVSFISAMKSSVNVIFPSEVVRGWCFCFLTSQSLWNSPCSMPFVETICSVLRGVSVILAAYWLSLWPTVFPTSVSSRVPSSMKIVDAIVTIFSKIQVRVTWAVPPSVEISLLSFSFKTISWCMTKFRDWDA